MTTSIEKRDLERRVFTEEQLKLIYAFRSKHSPGSIGCQYKKLIKEQELTFVLSGLHTALIENNLLGNFLSGRIGSCRCLTPKPLRRYWKEIQGESRSFFYSVLRDARKWKLNKLEDLMVDELTIKSSKPDKPSLIYLYFELDDDIRSHNERYYFEKILRYDVPTARLNSDLPIFIFQQYGDGSRTISTLYLFLERVALTKLGYLTQDAAENTAVRAFIKRQERTAEGRGFIERVANTYFAESPVVHSFISDRESCSCLHRFMPDSIKYRLFWCEGLYESLIHVKKIKDQFTRLDNQADKQTLSLKQIALRHLASNQARGLFLEHWDESCTSFSMMRNKVVCCNVLSLLYDMGRFEEQHLSKVLTRGLGYGDYHLNLRKNNPGKSRSKSKKSKSRTELRTFNMTETARALEKKLAQAKVSAVDHLYYQYLLMSSEDQERIRMRLSIEAETIPESVTS